MVTAKACFYYSGNGLPEFCEHANHPLDRTGTLYLKNVVLLDLYRSPPQARNTDGDFHACVIQVDWGIA